MPICFNNYSPALVGALTSPRSSTSVGSAARQRRCDKIDDVLDLASWPPYAALLCFVCAPAVFAARVLVVSVVAVLGFGVFVGKLVVVVGSFSSSISNLLITSYLCESRSAHDARRSLLRKEIHTSSVVSKMVTTSEAPIAILATASYILPSRAEC
jgi:hypothetical protein